MKIVEFLNPFNLNFKIVPLGTPLSVLGLSRTLIWYCDYRDRKGHEAKRMIWMEEYSFHEYGNHICEMNFVHPNLEHSFAGCSIYNT